MDEREGREVEGQERASAADWTDQPGSNILFSQRGEGGNAGGRQRVDADGRRSFAGYRRDRSTAIPRE